MTLPVHVFDAYGTLLNVHAAIGRHRDACGPDADRISDLWRAKQLEYTWTLTLAGQYEDFWVLTGRALDYALARFPSADKAVRQRLMEAYFSLDAFADARPALQALKERGHKTAILSNGSPKMLNAAVAAAGMDNLLDEILSVDAIRIYKPRPEVYALVTQAFSVAPADVTFISSNRWDIMGATAFGFRGIWLNRAGLPDEYPAQAPHRIITDITNLSPATA
jgi:2-haloacid dehalogenase